MTRYEHSLLSQRPSGRGHLYLDSRLAGLMCTKETICTPPQPVDPLCNYQIVPASQGASQNVAWERFLLGVRDKGASLRPRLGCPGGAKRRATPSSADKNRGFIFPGKQQGLAIHTARSGLTARTEIPAVKSNE